MAAAINETGIGRFIYVDDVATDGADGSSARPFQSLADAVDVAVAPGGPLANGVKTKIVVRTGVYGEQRNAGLWVDGNAFPVWPGQAADTPLIIEGEGDGSDVIFSGVDGDYRQLTFEGKNNLVLRNLTFQNLVSAFNFDGIDTFGAVHLEANPDDQGDGRYGPNRGHDLLIDNVTVIGSDRPGAAVYFYDDVTIRNSNFDQNVNKVGLHFRFVNDALVEDTSISGNGTGAPPVDGEFGNSGFLFAATNTTLRRVDASGNTEGSGIRMDFQAENVLIEDSMFNANSEDGVFFETAVGPVTIRRSELNDNARSGVHLATTDDFTVEDSEIIGNGFAGVMVTEQIRDQRNFSPPTFLWAQDPAYWVTNFQRPDGSVVGGIPSAWNTDTTITGTTIEATGGQSFVVASEYANAGQWQNHYDQWVADEFVGSGNTYRAVRSDPFNVSTSTGSRTNVGLDGWKQRTGSDADATLNADGGGGNDGGGGGGGTTQTTFGNGGAPWAVDPGSTVRIQAEKFDVGGQGVSYNETSAQNFAGGDYRPDAPGVDVSATTVGWFESGEWLEYTVDVRRAGSHRLALRMARNGAGGGFDVSLGGGASLTGNQTLGDTGGWEAYVVREFDVDLPAGEQVLRFTRTDGGGLNLDYLELTPQNSGGGGGGGGTVVGQVGTTSGGQNRNGTTWTSVSFDQPIDDPIVVLGAVSWRGGDPLTTRIRNVTDTGFEWTIQEYDYRDVAHTTEFVDWIAIARGEHALSDGTRIVADDASVSHVPRTIGWSAFDAAPVVFSQIASSNEAEAVITRHRDVTASGFQIKLDEEEANDRVHAEETVTYIAVERGETSLLTAAATPDEVTHIDYDITLSGSTDAADAFFAQMQTLDGGDPATIRVRQRDGDRVRINLQEERSFTGGSAGDEIKHTDEVVGYLSLPFGVVTAESSVGGGGGGGNAPNPTIANGSFEQGLQGWSAAGNVATGAWAGTSDGGTAVAFGSGNTTNNGSLTQSIATVAGGRYRVTFDYRVDGRSDATQTLRARATGGGSTIGSIDTTAPGGSGYQTRSFEFTASSNQTVIRFSDVSGETSAIDGWLDNVRVALA